MKHKTIMGPLGFPMKEQAARDLEKLLKSLPNECRAYRKAQTVPTSVELLPGERADISVLSTDIVDSDREIVLPSGIDVEPFRRNPVVNYGHNWDDLPVGKAQWIKCVDNKLKAKTVYAPRPDDWGSAWFPDAVWSLVSNGYLNGKSIGIVAKKLRAPTTKELMDRPEWKSANVVIESSLMFEYSVVNTPANGEALVEAVSKGIVDVAMAKRLGFTLPVRKAIKRIAEPLRLDPEQIAEIVITRLKNRGRV